MSYVRNNLIDNEVVIATGKIHWWIFVPGSAILLYAVSMLISMGEKIAAISVLLFLVGIALLIRGWIISISTELALTDRRVIAKFGFIGRSSVELSHKNVESFNVDQGILGRLFNFGTVIVNGTGGVRTPIPRIANPLVFRKQVLSVIEAQKS